MGTDSRPAWRDPELRTLALLLVLTVAAGSVVYQILEGWSLLDSVYFSVVTLATVGFGDIAPKTPPGKLFTIAYIMVGIGILAGFANALSKRWVARRLNRGPADAGG